MNYTYAIAKLVLGIPASVSITEAEFSDIRQAANGLFALLQVEMDYDSVIGNWIQLEKALLSLSVDWSVRINWKRTEIDRQNAMLDRHIANLLSSARGFFDRTTRKVRKMPLGSRNDVKWLTGIRATEYDSKLSYRVVELLRNHVQHYGFPTHGINFGSRWEDADGARGTQAKLIFHVSAYLRPQTLASDPRFKQPMLEELRASKGDQVPLIPMLREYVESLSVIMGEFRKFYAEREKTWAALIDNCAARFRAAAPDDSDNMVALAAIKLGERKRILEEIHLGVEYKERIAALRDINRPLPNLHKREVRS